MRLAKDLICSRTSTLGGNWRILVSTETYSRGMFWICILLDFPAKQAVEMGGYRKSYRVKVVVSAVELG